MSFVPWSVVRGEHEPALRVPTEALRVPQPERPHQRVWKRVVRGRHVVPVDAKDLPSGRREILGSRPVVRVPSRDVDQAVWTECERISVVIGAAGHGVQKHRFLHADAAGVPHSNHAVHDSPRCRFHRVAQVDEPVRSKVGVDGDSHQPGFVSQDFVHCELWPRLVGELAFHDRANEAPVLRHAEAPVGRLSQGPHGLEALCDDSDDRGVGDLLAGGP